MDVDSSDTEKGHERMGLKRAMTSSQSMTEFMCESWNCQAAQEDHAKAKTEMTSHLLKRIQVNALVTKESYQLNNAYSMH